MLLSIDRVLQLLSEGKTTGKISELAGCSEDDVKKIIDEARELLSKYEKPHSRKKIILKKIRDAESTDNEKTDNSVEEREIFDGAELSAIPFSSSLVIYTDGASKGNPGHAGIGIVIYDQDNRQVGKVSCYIGETTNNFAEYTAIIKALKIAKYFKTKSLKLRTDSELVVKQVKGEYKVKNEELKKLFDTVIALKKDIPNCKFEHVTRNLNEKADYFASKAASTPKYQQ